jgi:hypothetical protein
MAKQDHIKEKLRRHQRQHLTKKGRYPYVPPIYLPESPIAGKRGYLQVHRAWLYEKHGPGPHQCYWCGTLLEWPRIETDHVDGNGWNNHPGNLVVACKDCNNRRKDDGNPRHWKPGSVLDYEKPQVSAYVSWSSSKPLYNPSWARFTPREPSEEEVNEFIESYDRYFTPDSEEGEESSASRDCETSTRSGSRFILW